MMITKFPLQLIVVFVGLTSLSSSEEIWCDFQESICSWTQYMEDDFDWVRRCGSTPSLGTGPSNGQGGFSCDHYLYIEASNPRQTSDVARLVSEPLYNADSYYCLTFWYHMRGFDIGMLGVRLATEEGGVGGLIWYENGARGNQWHRAELSVRVMTEGTMVVLEAVRGNGYEGDISIDTVTISSDICPNDAIPTLKPTTMGIMHTTMEEILPEAITTSAFVEEIHMETDVPTTSEVVETDKPNTEFVTELVEMIEVITEDASITTVFPGDYSSSERMIVETDPPIIETEEREPVVTCTENLITVQIPKEDFGLADVTDLHLLEQACTGIYDNNYVTFSFAPTSCGTTSKEEGDSIVYSNVIRSSAMGTDGIVRNEDVSIPITCSFDKKSSVSNEFLPVFDRIAFGANGKGDFQFNMRFYQDSAFETEKQEPIIARIGDMMYFALSVDISDEDVVLYADNCKAVPNDAPSNWYYVIQDGCMRDSTMQEFSSSSAHRRLFGMEAFMFLSGGSKIVLECDLVLCDERDGISRCPTSCETADRKRRAAASSDRIIKRSIARTVQLVSPDESDITESKPTHWLTPSSIVSIVMFVLAAILCIATVIKVQQDQHTRSGLPT